MLFTRMDFWEGEVFDAAGFYWVMAEVSELDLALQDMSWVQLDPGACPLLSIQDLRLLSRRQLRQVVSGENFP
jgi:hypothetical protein